MQQLDNTVSQWTAAASNAAAAADDDDDDDGAFDDADASTESN